MWNQFLNESRSENKFQNTPVIILGSRHSGKRSLVDSLFDISKTTIHNKRLAAHVDANKMRLKGLTTAIDYAYLNVLDLTDIDYSKSLSIQELILNCKFTWLKNTITLISMLNLLIRNFSKKQSSSLCSISLLRGIS